MMSNSKWLKYDLHMHSFASKHKDNGRVKEMDAQSFADILINAGVEVFSVTDHNVFDSDFYSKLKDYIKNKKIRLIYGIELDVYVDSINFFQMGAYFSPNVDMTKISPIIVELYKDGKKPLLSEIIAKLFHLKTKFILIPEGNKAKGIVDVLKHLDDISKDDIYKFAMYKIFSAYDVRPSFNEISQNEWAANFYTHSVRADEILRDKIGQDRKTLLDNIRKRIHDEDYILEDDEKALYEYIVNYGSYFSYFTFSDWHNSEPYSPVLNNFIFGSYDTYFDSFEMAVLDPKSRIIRTTDNEVVIPGNILGSVQFSMKGVQHPIQFSPGLNVIVGKRGSGKSLLLSVIERLSNRESLDIKEYKAFDIKNISGNYYDGIPLSEGQLSSIAIIKQDKIKEVYENPDRALQTISSKFPILAPYDKSKLELVLSIALGVKPYDKNYKSITSIVKQIRRLDFFTFAIHNKLNFTTIDGYFTNAETMLNKIKTDISSTGINSERISVQLSVIKNNHVYFKKLYDLYNSIFDKHNTRIGVVNKGKTELQRVMTDLRREINQILTSLKNNFSILLEFNKLKHLLNNFALDAPQIGKAIVNKYMFVTTYKIPDNITDLLVEELTNSISKLKNDTNSMTLLEKYVNGEKNLKSTVSNMTDGLKKFINSDIFLPKKEFYQMNSKSVPNLEINNYNDILKLLDEGSITNLSNASLGMQSVAYLDLIFDLSESILMFDQPEDNIDNDYISNYLVPLIKSKKRDKQLIFVTHNPSVAVYGDAFNYIYAENDGNITYTNYFIENIDDKLNIMKILDGGKPSFSNRNKKYGNILGEEEYGNNNI